MGSLSVSSKSSITTTTGGTVKVEPVAKTLANISEVYDKTITIAAGATHMLWANTGIALGYPVDWESAQFIVETAASECRLTISDDQGTPVLMTFLCNDKFPFNMPQINTGVATSATGNKVKTMQATNPEATAIVVRIVLYGPMVA